MKRIPWEPVLYLLLLIGLLVFVGTTMPDAGLREDADKAYRREYDARWNRVIEVEGHKVLIREGLFGDKVIRLD